MISLQPAPGRQPRGGPREASLAIERFLKCASKPVLIEPGDDPLPIAADSFALTSRGSALTIECWSETRNLVRRVVRVKLERQGRLELEVERFGGRTGPLTLIDLERASNQEAARRGARLKYRERFRQSLHRQFPDWRIVEISTEPDLEHTLSPSYPRAFLRRGSAGLAAIGAAEDCLSPDGALTFGLIWLDYLRRRETRMYIEGLAIFVPAGIEATTCHRVRFLNTNVARYAVYVHDPSGWEDAVRPEDYTNLSTRLDPCHRPLAEASLAELELAEWIESIHGVERRNRPDGSVSFAVHGLEFAHVAPDKITFGLDRKHTSVHATPGLSREIESLAMGLLSMRRPDAVDRSNLLVTKHPEAWLESQIRANIERVDPTLLPTPVYGQVPEFAAGDRSILDLLAVDRDGRLVVIEVKAVQDMHLPLQALDYWMRVRWHQERGEFAKNGYFSGISLNSAPPRLILAAPALEWHPSNEAVLGFFQTGLDILRLGVGIEWRRDLRVVFQTPIGHGTSCSSTNETGARHPQTGGDAGIGRTSN
ncbi:MAG: hypothetical protein ABL995_06640 [Bryobacteraceae bacterium]